MWIKVGVKNKYLEMELKAFQAATWILDETELPHRMDDLEVLKPAKSKWQARGFKENIHHVKFKATMVTSWRGDWIKEKWIVLTLKYYEAQY